MADLIQIGIDVKTNIKQATSDLDKMGGSVVNNIRTIDRLEAEVNQLNKALNTGRVTEAAYSKGMQQINGELLLFQQRAAKATQVEKRFGVAAATGGKNLNRFNMTLQQGGYQLQDFIVQLQGGTSFFTAFSQQGSQFASIFGPKGAVIGAVIAIGSAIGGSLVAALGDASGGVDEFSEDLKNLNSTLDQYRDLSERIADAGNLSEEFGAAAGEIREILTALQQIQQITLKKQISELGGVGEVVRKSVMEVSETLYGLPVAFERVERLTAKQVQAAQEFLGATDGALDAPYAVEYLKLLEEMQSSNTLEEQAAAAQKLSGFLAEHVNTRGDEIENLEQIQELQELLLNLASTSSAETARAAKEEYDAYQRNIDQRFKGEEALMQMSVSAKEQTKEKIALSEQDKYILEMQTVFLKAQQRIRAENGARMEENLRLERQGYAAAAEGAQTLRNEIAANQQEMVVLFETTEDLKEQLGEGAYEALRLAGVDMTSGINSAYLAAASMAAELNMSLETALRLRAMASDEEAVMSQAVVKGKVTDRYDVDTLLGMGYTEEYLKLIGKIKDETKKLGKTTKDSLSAAEEAIEEARQAAEEYAAALDGTVVSAVGSVSDAWADFVMRGFKDFKGFVGSVLDSFKNMISQMIAMAARNRIMLSLGIGGVAPTAAMAGSGMLGGAGILGGGGAGIGAAMSGVGSGIAGIMSGGGLGASFANLGGLLSGSVGGLGAIGAAIPAVAAVAVVVGLFSKKVKELDSGLRVTVDNTDTLVESYRKLETSRLFGLMKKQSTQFDEAEEETAAPITKAVADVQASVVDMASALGIGSDAFSDFSYQFQVSLKGLSEEQALVAIQQEFVGVADAMADLIPDLMDFAREGETSSQVLERLRTDLLLVNNVFRLLGRSAEKMSIQAADAASRLVSAAGGQSAFVSKTQTLVGTYLDPTEQLSYYQRQLEGVFEGGLPSRSQVKGILQEGSIEELETLYGGDTIQTLGTIFQLQDQIAAEEKARKEEAKRKAAAAAAAAARASRAAQEAAKRAAEEAAKAQQRILDERLGLEEELLKLQGNTAELRRRELEALDPTNRALQEMIWKLQDAKEVMDGISESDFATLFDYQRAVAMARVNTVANNPQPVSPMPAVVNGSPTVSPDSMPSGSSEGSTLENNTFVRQSLVEIIKYSKRTSDTLRKFDNDGLPPERT